MHSSLLFKFFPPPKFMLMRHAGLEISDDAIRCLEYAGVRAPHLRIAKFAETMLPAGLVDGGEIKDDKALAAVLSKFDRDNDLTYAKISVPEEKAYLFQTDIATTDPLAIAQNIEFKIEENVPLAVADAVFYFDILPMTVTGGALRASVSVVPRAHIEKVIDLLRQSGIAPIAFEVVPKSIAKAVIPAHSTSTVMIVQIMKKKSGIYIVAGGVVCFTSTVSWGAESTAESGGSGVLTKEISRVSAYWLSHGQASAEIKDIILVGRPAPLFEDEIRKVAAESELSVSIGNAWSNSFSLDRYVPAISMNDSLDYAVAAGLAMDLQ